MKRAGRFRPLHKFAISILAILVMGLVWRQLAQPNPDNSARFLASAIERSDWGAVYDMSSQEERRLQSWGRDEFVTLMRTVQDDCVGDIATVSFEGDWQGQSTRKFFLVEIDGSKSDRRLAVHFFRNGRNWHPAISSLPLRLFNGAERPTQLRARKLYDLCMSAHVTSFVRLDDRVEFSVTRLGEYLDGRTSWDQVSRPYLEK